MTRRQHPAGAGKLLTQVRGATWKSCAQPMQSASISSAVLTLRALLTDSAAVIVSRGLGAVDHQRGNYFGPWQGRAGGSGGGETARETLQESSQLISQLIKSARSARLEIDQSGSKRHDCNLNEKHFMTR